MKKIVLTCFLSATALTGFAAPQDITEVVLDAAEDTTHVVTIADIVTLQEKVTTQHYTTSHFEKVWGYKSFFNISYQTYGKISPKKDYTLGFPEINGDKVPAFKADYGLALQLGHNYNLLKKPVANILNVNIDYTYIDLSLAHYKAESGEYLYNSDNTWEEQSSTGRTVEYQYMPWALGKYDVTYGMNVGPSLTLAPFTPLNNKDLDFLKLNIYYHIGYQFGLLWMTNNKDADKADQTYSYTKTDPIKINWSHGLVQSFGFNLSWKTIGLGFETRWDNRTYQSFDTSTYGKTKYGFGGKSSRIYLRICY